MTSLSSRRAGAITALTALLFSTAACSSLGPTETGFLAPGPAATADAAHPKVRAYRDAAFDPAAYDSVIVDPVAFRPSTKAPQVDTADVEALTQAYRAKLVEAFSNRYAEAQAPGPHTLRVRAAITDIGSPNRALNVVTMVAVVTPVSAGGASTEAEVVDSLTGRRLVALQAAATGGVSPKGYLSRYDQARRAVGALAMQLRDRTVGPVQVAAR